MEELSRIRKLGLLASVALPFFNIPLMLRIVQRRSSEDLSLIWVIGVFSCICLMLPAALQSKDIIFKVFNIFNFILFSGVTALVLYFRLNP